MHRLLLVCLPGFLLLSSGAIAEYRMAVTDVGGRNPSLYPSYQAALADVPSGERSIASADMILSKARFVEDGVLGALELQIDEGCEAIKRGRVDFLKFLHEDLKSSDHPDPHIRFRAEAYVAAALAVAGEAPLGPNPESEAIMEAIIDAIEADAVLMRPIGFMAWSDQLLNTYRQSRAAQVPLMMTPDVPVALPELGETPAEQFALAKLISDTVLADEKLAKEHAALMALYEVIYGPRGYLTVTDMDNAGDLARLQQSAEYERVFGRGGEKGVEWQLLPHPFGRMDALQRRLISTDGSISPIGLADAAESVESGARTLFPRAGGGFTDLQQYSLQPMLSSADLTSELGLEPAPSYEARLRVSFAGELTADRPTKDRTAVKRSEEHAATGDGPRPFAIEPLPKVYLRRANAVRALREGLDSVLGSSTPRFVKALRPDGTRTGSSCTDELQALERKLAGCYYMSSTDLGLVADATETSFDAGDLPALADEAYGWLAAPSGDEDFAWDVRLAKPVEELLDGRYRLWTRSGVQLVRLEIVPEAGSPITGWMGVERVLDGVVAATDLPVTDSDLRATLDERPQLRHAHRAMGARPKVGLFARLGQVCLWALLVLVLGSLALLTTRTILKRRGPAKRRPSKRGFATRRGPDS